jgi:uncharacterized protein (TIGR02118 family)
MVRISVLYPNEPGRKFDHDYYAHKHMPLVQKRLSPVGLLRYEVDKGLAGATPESKPPFVGACHLYFKSVEEFRKAMGQHGAELMGDVPNYTDIQPQMQISEIV